MPPTRLTHSHAPMPKWQDLDPEMAPRERTQSSRAGAFEARKGIAE